MEYFEKKIIRLKFNSAISTSASVINNLIKEISKCCPELTNDRLFEIKICIVEAVNNAILHGNKENRNRKVFIKIEPLTKHIRCTIKDEGEGFLKEEFERSKNSFLAKKQPNPNGRGLQLINQYADCVEQKNDGKTLQLYFLK